MQENNTMFENEEVEIVKTREETDKKCASCGGTMDYDPETKGLLCPYCGSKKAINHATDEDSVARENDFLSAEHTQSYDWGTDKKTVICKSCGAESIYDALQTSDVCPYCGSNQVMEAHTVETIPPGGVCPFVVTPEQAGNSFTKWLKRKLFCPSKAKKSAKADSFNGVYIPYWTFDTETESIYTARYGIDRSYTDSKGNRHTTTDWYRTSGSYNRFIDDQLVCASKRYNTAMLRSIEPYNTAENKKYKPEYLAGFISERYSIGLQEGWGTAKRYIERTLDNEITNKIRRENNADHVSNLNFSTEYDNIMYKYLLLPVWLSSFKYKNKVFQFMVNGETGKVGGNAPISALRVAIAVLLGVAVVGALVYFYIH